MPGPNRAPRGGYQKPKDLKKTVGRLLGYLTRSKLPLLAVFGCLLASVCANIGGSYMMRGIINDFIWSGCTDFAGLALAILQLIGIYLIGCVATYCQSAAMVRLNRQLAGEESIAVKVTLTGGDGYAIEGFEELPDCLDYADGILTATIPNADFTGGSYVLNAIVSRNGETATLPAGVILRVQVYDRAPSFRLTAKGKLDVLNPASEIVYTPRLTNAQGTVTDIRLEGADAELFAAEVVDGVVHLTMAKGCTYSTRTTYKVIPVLTFCGQEVTGSTLSIRVTQSVLRLAKLSNRTVYQSQTAPLVQVLSITSPATAEFGEITLNSRSTAALRNAVEAAGGIEVSGGIVRFPAKAFASLKPGRYTVILDVTPENAAADAKPIQARFTLTVQK